jgi:hypothetical protein
MEANENSNEIPASTKELTDSQVPKLKPPSFPYPEIRIRSGVNPFYATVPVKRRGIPMTVNSTPAILDTINIMTGRSTINPFLAVKMKPNVTSQPSAGTSRNMAPVTQEGAKDHNTECVFWHHPSSINEVISYTVYPATTTTTNSLRPSSIFSKTLGHLAHSCQYHCHMGKGSSTHPNP